MAVLRIKSPHSGLGRLLDATQRAGLDQLRSILACTFTFDSEYFEQALEALGALHPEGPDLLRSIPVDVVCDRRHYHGHGGTYNVRCWPGSNLFHPKLLLLLFTDRVVWLEGSQNLTRAGYCVNRELASLHESTRMRLPDGLTTLVAELARQRIDAAVAVDNATSRAKTDVANGSLTSLDGPLLDGLLGRVPRASHVYVVSPFYDRREHAEPSIDSSVLRRLANQYRDAKFWVYLPQIKTNDDAYALQASQRTFASVFGPRAGLGRLALCGVPSEREPLHAKLLAVRHGPRESEVTFLAGSPNLTEIALCKQGTNANVELAREATTTWAQFSRLLDPLPGKFKKIADCRFEPPKFETAFGWHALASATYDPLREVLEVQWVKPNFATSTRLEYSGKTIALQDGHRCPGFLIQNAEFRVEAIRIEDPRRRSWCPIEIPLEVRLALAQLPSQNDLPPEWWLSQLGSLAITGDRFQVEGTNRGVGPMAHGQKFQWAARVRDLTGRLRYIEQVITDDNDPDERRTSGLLDLLTKIFDAHEPTLTDDKLERTWRMWVRLELTQLLARMSKETSSTRVRSAARKLAATTASMPVPAAVTEPWQALLGST